VCDIAYQLGNKVVVFCMMAPWSNPWETVMLFIIRCVDRTDAPGLRASVRPRHLDYLGSFGDRVVLAGAALAADGTTPTGSLIVLEAADLAAAENAAAHDPYAVAGLFDRVTVEPFRLALQHAKV
jgi:uncharacterized protein YciI